MGRGFSGAPREALVADLATDDLGGASFRAGNPFDTVGSLGPLCGHRLMVAHEK